MQVESTSLTHVWTIWLWIKFNSHTDWAISKSLTKCGQTQAKIRVEADYSLLTPSRLVNDQIYRRGNGCKFLQWMGSIYMKYIWKGQAYEKFKNLLRPLLRSRSTHACQLKSNTSCKPVQMVTFSLLRWQILRQRWPNRCIIHQRFDRKLYGMCSMRPYMVLMTS